MKYIFVILSFLALCLPTLFANNATATPRAKYLTINPVTQLTVHIGSFTPKNMPVSIRQASIATIQNGQYGLRFFVDNPDNLSINSLTVALPVINNSGGIKKIIVKKVENITSNEVFIPINTTLNISTGENIKAILVEATVSPAISNSEVKALISSTTWTINFSQIPDVLTNNLIIAFINIDPIKPFCTSALQDAKATCGGLVSSFSCSETKQEYSFSCHIK